MRRSWPWLRVLIVLQLLRLLIASLFELVPQEAYYLYYARHPALSYFDHPGLLAWALALPAQLAPPPAVLVRVVPWLFAAITLAGMARLARRFVPSDPGRAVLLLATTGVFSILSVVALPDAPLVAAWTWALCFLADALLDGRRGAWLAAGLCAGLAFEAKYTGAFLLLGAALLLLRLPRGRRALATPWPWLGLAVAGLTTAPVWIWNAGHGWASFLFQTAGRVEQARGLSPWNLLGLVGSELVLVLPPLLFVWARTAVRAVPRLVRGAPDEEEAFLAAFSLLPAAVLLGLSLGVVVKPNWPFPVWIAGASWAARRSGPWLLRWNAAASVVVHAAVLVELFAYPVRLGDDTWVGLAGTARGDAGPAPPCRVRLLRRRLQDHRRAAAGRADRGVRAEPPRRAGAPVRLRRPRPADARRPDRALPRLGSAPLRRLRRPDLRRRGSPRTAVRCSRSRHSSSAGASASSAASAPGAASTTARPEPRRRRGCSATRPARGGGRWRPAAPSRADRRASRSGPPRPARRPRSPAPRSRGFGQSRRAPPPGAAPRVSPDSMARATCVIGSSATRIGSPRARASDSVSPTRPSWGSVKRVYGTSRPTVSGAARPAARRGARGSRRRRRG